MFTTAIPEHKIERIDMTLEQPSERQASGTDLTADLAQRQTAKAAPPNSRGKAAANNPASCNATKSALG